MAIYSYFTLKKNNNNPRPLLCMLFKTYTFSLLTYWRASVASETLTGVTQSKIGDVCDLYICMDVRKAFLYFDPRVFVLVRLSTPSQTSLNRILCLSISTRITLEIELFTFYVGSAFDPVPNFTKQYPLILRPLPVSP